ncbi:glycosyltransferase [Gordonia aichiensis]
MSHYLLASTPLVGHVAPLVAVARDLTARGHEVTMLTGSRFAPSIRAAGAQPLRLDGVADFDERELDTYLPHADRYHGIGLSRYQLTQTFVRPMPEQWRGLRAALDAAPVDAILVDNFFLGALPLLVGQRRQRPPVLAVGVGPLAQFSRNTAPPNSGFAPSWSHAGMLRNRAMNSFARRVLFRSLQRYAIGLYSEMTESPVPPGFPFVLDVAASFDSYLHLGPREFEYPLDDLLPTVRFVGPIDTSRSIPAPEMPSWWNDIDKSRPIIHVTQGTLANSDFDSLVRPAATALADWNVTVVASTGGRPVETLGRLPDNCRAAEFLPYDQLLPATSAIISNGGYGTVMLAHAHGVPAVIAPGAEDKPEVAARVAFHGTGIDLRTDSPTHSQIRNAVARVLDDSSYRQAAATLSSALSQYAPLESIAQALEHASSHGDERNHPVGGRSRLCTSRAGLRAARR